MTSPRALPLLAVVAVVTSCAEGPLPDASPGDAVTGADASAPGTDALPPGCGDGVCLGWPWEAATDGPGLEAACPQDCGWIPGCGDGPCLPADGETWVTCPWDCAGWCPGPPAYPGGAACDVDADGCCGDAEVVGWCCPLGTPCGAAGACG